MHLLCIWTWGCKLASEVTMGEPATVLWLVNWLGKETPSSVPQHAQVCPHALFPRRPTVSRQ